jgi:hypothetical protein
MSPENKKLGLRLARGPRRASPPGTPSRPSPIPGVLQGILLTQARSRSGHMLGQISTSPEPRSPQVPHLRLARGCPALGSPNPPRPSPSQAMRTKRVRRPTRDTRIQCAHLSRTVLQRQQDNSLVQANVMITRAPLCAHDACVTPQCYLGFPSTPTCDHYHMWL